MMNIPFTTFLRARIALAALLTLVALPALAQEKPDPVIGVFANGAQLMLQQYQTQAAALAKAQADLAAKTAALACWVKTGKACVAGQH